MTTPRRSPWAWIPSLYFAEGLPYVAVMTISVILYKKLGISNTDIALYTSWLYLPWVIKPFWSPFVDLLKTKRWWIVAMQILVGAGLGGIALTIPAPDAFRWSLCIFWLVAFSSATHDIAADGYYMLALKEHEQAMYVGIRSTFYRIATIVGQGLLIILAGSMEAHSGLPAVRLEVQAGPQTEMRHTLPPGADVMSENPGTVSCLPEGKSLSDGEPTFYFEPQTIGICSAPIHPDSARSLMDRVEAANIRHGFVPAPKAVEEKAAAESDSTAWLAQAFRGFESWIRRNFGEDTPAASASSVQTTTAPALGVVAVRLSAPPEKGEEIVLTTAHHRGDHSISLLKGERLTFTDANWNRPAYLLLQADPKLRGETSTTFRSLSGNIPLAWSVTFFILAGFFVAIGLYHRCILPRPASDAPRAGVSARSIFSDFIATFASFFRKKQIGVALLFMLLYRLPEAQLVKLINPFLLDPAEKGGLGLTTGEVGFVYGTVGIIGLTLGGIIGGLAAARGGLQRWLWPMAWGISLTCITFVYLAMARPESLWVINLCVFIEQFGYGFGFTAYMLYLIYFSEGTHKTAHYAICTAFMALGMMLPGMMAGWLQELIGYEHFFIWVMICCVATIAVCALIKIDPSFGRKEEPQEA